MTTSIIFNGSRVISFNISESAVDKLKARADSLNVPVEILLEAIVVSSCAENIGSEN